MNGIPSIGSLVKENTELAGMLHKLGILFYKDADKTLDQVCSHFELLRKSKAFDLNQLSHYPIEILVSVLRHSHQLFIKQKLPFLFHTILELDPDRFYNPEIAADLKMVFPIFAEDFIRHIYEEEDTLFEYIHFLMDCTRKIDNPGLLFIRMKAHGIQHFAMHHAGHDNEMAGIRQLTGGYSMPADTDLFTFTLYRELEDFEMQLRQHAQIENLLLLPKALRLENEVRWRLDQIRPWN
jgi:regulator of cell morphogenesis and NO signaling